MNEKDIWDNKRNRLNGSYDHNDDWDVAIQLFNDRLNDKFFNPLKEIIVRQNEEEKFTGEGFTILTVLCAIIECFAAFRIGKIHKYDLNGTHAFYYRTESKKIFSDFLKDRNIEIFKDNFYEIDENGNYSPHPIFSATDFYSKVRCGLMHEARTKGNWTINAYPNPGGAEREKIFMKEEDGKKKIYRTVLYYKLKDYLNSYSCELRKKDNEEMRRLFARKLDHLLDFPEDPNFGWWIP